ncbi:MAG: ROK family protein, partial [Planctomycetota bacterium]|nr:ROK family protein [Planctomycetota bacterium]
GPLDASSGTLLEIPTLPGLQYFPLRGTLVQRYETRVEISNDGNCFALGEALYGAASSEAVVLGVTLGTGCGAGLVVEGRIHEGATFNAGEVYRAPCGERSFDEVLSGPGLEQLYRERVGSKRPGPEISELARNGDPAARAVFEAFGIEVARGLGILVAVFDPQVVVLGGGVGSAFDCFRRSSNGRSASTWPQRPPSGSGLLPARQALQPGQPGPQRWSFPLVGKKGDEIFFCL